MQLYPEILIEGGTFQMGSEEFDREMPIHEVTVDSFWIGKYLLTFEWFDRFCQETERTLLKDFGWGRNQRPVIMASWFDAVHFCNWLSDQHEFQKVYELSDNLVLTNWSATGYRLPTEAEWEFAAKGGNHSKNHLFAGANTLRKTAWHIGNAGDKSQPVGGKLPNELGLFDMSGNVWEWCWDWFDENYYNIDCPVNPKGPRIGTHRIIRGGSWYDVPNRLRVANRLFYQPDSKISSTGFRIVRNEFSS